MKNIELSQEMIASLTSVVGQSFLFLDEATRKDYGHDETEDYSFPPSIVLKPGTTQEVSEIMKIASQYRIPVVPIGGRTGLSGGALSIYGGIGLSMERFNKIEIDEQNLQGIVEPAVITQVFREAAFEKGLFYPPDPSSQGSCTIGGNVAENAGGARALKYGVTKDYVLNLEVVLPSGDIIWTGANTLKNSTGYNLTQLMVGSEGTLGIITKIVMKLLPANSHNILMMVPFFKAEQACEAVAQIFRAGIVPSALEFMERDAIDWTLKYVDGVSLDIKDNVEAHLLIEVDGNYPDVLFTEAEKIMGVLEQFEIDEILFTDTEDQKNALWKMRRAVGEAVKSNSIYKEEDTVVPRYELPALLAGIKAAGKKYGFHSVCYGHAGDGNLHVNIIKGDMTDENWNTEVPKGIREIFELTVSLKGTLSGEHGIGYVQKNYMDIAFNDVQLQLMKSIKNVFDPLNILNPGKILPDHL
ncbi:FAD-linked oxidase C-terminal domain-containing protein [Flavobacterium sp. DG1-102-2]|uniref:FAD-binding oxidoreductase n=1 Tax=Flavobacterium sp. DG1-102-2 TaxID=3081663 RepID=UPI002949AC46|nr:FAD-linked oxidase C-terminal domain-containing protein [Flavobacterium sp. DG1-102-2]MDV6169809.1 FAD-linked oxidase C-terminal domain-containing protein [Flavobacterium sp. DG1-102-2]